MEEKKPITELLPSELMEIKSKEYMEHKRSAAASVLYMGKILFDTKDKISHGHWSDFLDNKVKESKRTAQRYITLYKDFGHLMKDKIAFDEICELGQSQLEQLRKLPEKFRKPIEVIRLDDNKEEHVKKIKVLDKEKLVDFLNEAVDRDGDHKLVKEMTADELSKYIKESQEIPQSEEVLNAQGIFTPSKDDMFNEMSKTEGESVVFDKKLYSEPEEEKPLTLEQTKANDIVSQSRELGRTVFNECMEGSEVLCRLNKNLFEINDFAHFTALDVDMKIKVKKALKKIKGDAESTLTHALDLLEKM